MFTKTGKILYATIASFLVLAILIIARQAIDFPLLLFDRFLSGLGLLQIVLLATYAFIIVYNMSVPQKQARWRLRIWFVFTIVFYTQFLLGLLVSDMFMMSGDFHFPVPAVIIAAPVHRLQIGFMFVLFIVTVLLSGPAWCSQLCYLGACDNFMALKSKNITRFPFPSLILLKSFFLISVLLFAMFFRIFLVDYFWIMSGVLLYFIVGLMVMLVASRYMGLMIHCIIFCPIGTVVSFLKHINPFRFVINQNCVQCLQCIQACKYNALNIENISKQKIGITCTYCGDCLQHCEYGALEYKLFRFDAEQSRMIWITLTAALHTIFLGIARV